MFDRYTRQGDTHVRITQQPNDAADAARLHGEIRAKAEAEALRATINALGVRNHFKFATVASEYAAASGQHHTRAIFQLNGVDYDVRVTVEQNLHERIKQTIALALMEKIVESL